MVSRPSLLANVREQKKIYNQRVLESDFTGTITGPGLCTGQIQHQHDNTDYHCDEDCYTY